MKFSFRRHLLAGIGAAIIGVILLPILLIVFAATFLASIPSRIGEQAPIETWIYRGMDRVLNFNLMRQFRDDIYYRIRPHVELAEEYDRWWVIREMELAIERTNSALQSGEYALVIVLAFGGVFLDTSLYGVPMSLILTLLAIALSGLILTRMITIRILAFRPGVYMEEATDDLAVRMAFNRGPFSQGSSIAIALLTLLIGITRGRGYELGLDVVEMVASSTHPKDAERWRVEE